VKFRAFRGFLGGRGSRAKAPSRKGGLKIPEREIFSRKKAKNRSKRRIPIHLPFCVFLRLLAAKSNTAIPQEGAIWILVFLDLCSSVKSVVKI
jgi:hypothetical protein